MGQAVTVVWLPLGAGGRFVARNGRAYERLLARREGRVAQPLFHAALELVGGDGPAIIELAPAWGARSGGAGVALTGPVGARWAGRLRALRYEVRVVPGGAIPDRAWARGEDVVSAHAADADRILALAPTVPRLTWGRDEAGTGDMWNSNSVISWLLARAGLDAARLGPPDGGRAPGWQAGLTIAQR
ncbi:MAG: hypothetical protein J7513_04765 [Solirubrobacteraceae bacterium]|nr:hypothetical protein [Solirubrobacteraceae bacterium]